MKVLVAALLLLSLTASAETKEGKEKKAQMIDRAKDLRLAAETAEEHFKAEEYEDGCESVDELFRGMPAHLTGILSSMDLFKRKVERMHQEALVLLRDTHALDNRCKNGVDHQFVDAKKARKQMKEAAKKLKRHAKIIEDNSTEFSNSYRYNYEF
jgi:hypothetical protein